MSSLTPTYVIKDSVHYAFFEGRVIAEGGDFKKVEESAVDYLDGLSKKRKDTAKEKDARTATHVTTPSGLKGKILSRHEGLWGEKEMTVRLENGRIVKLTAHGEDWKYSQEKTASTDDPIAKLTAELEEDFGSNKEGLTERLTTLDSIITEARTRIAKASHEDSKELHKIVLQAEHEKGEVGDALAYLQDSDAKKLSESRFEFKAAEQGELGSKLAGTWLDETINDMLVEASSENFDKLLLEGPGQFVAELETGTLASQGSTSEMAADYITAKTAAFQGENVESYREKFVAAAEQARRAELADRQSMEHKEAATKEASVNDVPDEGLFL